MEILTVLGGLAYGAVSLVVIAIGLLTGAVGLLLAAGLLSLGWGCTVDTWRSFRYGGSKEEKGIR